MTDFVRTCLFIC